MHGWDYIAAVIVLLIGVAFIHHVITHPAGFHGKRSGAVPTQLDWRTE